MQTEPISQSEQLATTGYEHLLDQPLTVQEKTFVSYLLRGMKPGTAGRAVGTEKGYEWVKRPHIQQMLSLMKEQQIQELGFEVTRDSLTLMLMEAHRKAASSFEEVAAIREIAKINGLYEKQTLKIDVNVSKVSQLEGMSEQELLKLAGSKLDGLKPTREVIDGEFESIDDETDR